MYAGAGAPLLARRSLGDQDDEVFVQQAVLYFMGWYRAHKLDNPYVCDGVKQSLDAIRQSRNGNTPVKMAVLSNKPVVPSRAIVEALGLGEYFFQVYGGNSFHTKKPAPTAVQARLRQTRAHPNETSVFG